MPNGENNDRKNRPRSLAVLVVAHPDDESMFFVPTIVGLQQQHYDLWLLCLTNGNYDGLGKIRSKELYRTAQHILGFDRVLLCDDDDERIQDHPRHCWDIPHVAQRVQRMLQAELEKVETMTTTTTTKNGFRYDKVEIITFDEVGVSGHVNHRDTFAACRHLCGDGSSRPTLAATVHTQQGQCKLPELEMWVLVSDTSPLRYLPILGWIFLVLTWCGVMPKSSSVAATSARTITTTIRQRTFRLQHPSLNWRAMASHASQFVWYRRLFVVFSSYTYVNRLEQRSATNVA